MKKTLLIITLLTMMTTIFSISAVAYQSTLDWTTSDGYKSQITFQPDGFIINNTTGLPPTVFTYDKELVLPRQDYPDSKITFNMTITKNSDNTDFYAALQFRLSDATSPPWLPNINSVGILIYENKLVFRRLNVNGGVEATEIAEKEVNLVDGKEHKYEVNIDDSTKRASLVIDGDKTNKNFEITLTKLLSEGGYNVLGYKATVKITNFVASNNLPASSSSSSASSSSESTSQDSSIDESSSSDSSNDIESESSSSTSTSNKKSNSVFWIVLSAAIVLLGGAGVASYFFIYKKK